MLIELGHKVYIGARNEERGQKAADELGAKFVLLDVTKDTSGSRN
jgi:NADP-dependent 3-hydroxy acid dehydrogenase YdfG